MNSGQDIDVIPVEGCDEYLCKILDDLPAKLAVTTLCVLDDTNGNSFVAVYVGDRHIGYLPHPADPELIRILRECSQRGVTARARGKLIASWEARDQVKVRVSLADSHLLLGTPAGTIAVQDRETDSSQSEFDPSGDADARERRAWAEARPLSAKTAQPGWLGAKVRTTCATETAASSADRAQPTVPETQAPYRPLDPWQTRGEKRLDREEDWMSR